MRKTKIVATLGPASESEDVIEQMLDAGVDVVRQNFSHGTHEEHADVLETIHNKSSHIPVMLDTQGPEIRLRDVEEDVELDEDDTVTLSTAEKTGTAEELTISYPGLLKQAAEGDTVIIGDGDIELTVTAVNDEHVECTVVFGGPVSSQKSVNIPGKDVGPDGLTEKDVDDIAFGAKTGFDFIAVSFVKRADDIEAVQNILEKHDSEADIIAKIEHIKAVENLDEIVEASDGIMIARGDLGVELPASDVPILQKDIIKKCNTAGKPVITATQMLKSMTEHPRATRAEVSDVSNAVMDGTDAVMLSEETAVGEYPVKSVEVMASIVERAEEDILDNVHHTLKTPSQNIEDVISKSVWQATHDMETRFIVAHTTSGYTARNIAKYRPSTDIVAFTDSEWVQRQLNLVWGVRAYRMEFPDTVEEMIHESTSLLYENDMVDPGDTLVLSAGVPTAVSGMTNMMEVRIVEEILEETGGAD